MSFINQVKNEILNYNFTSNTFLPFMAGLIKSAGEFNINNGEILINTDSVTVFNLINKFFKKSYLKINDENVFKNISYVINIDKFISKKILDNCHIINDDFCDIIINKDINYLKNFIKGIFVGCATSSIVLGENFFSGYHLEFVFFNNNISNLFSEILANFFIIPKKIIRKNMHVVYLKSLDTICDLLVIVGASKSALKLQNEYVNRTIKNKINRQNNCFNANINKTITASIKQVEAIKIISSTIGIDALDDDLKKICNLRLQNRESSLNELVNLHKNIKKSTLNYKLNKIIKISEELNL